MNHPIGPRNNRILVIDDNPSIHDDFRKILSPWPEDAQPDFFGEPQAEVRRVEFQVDCASQGEEGLKAIQVAPERGQPYAMVFVDMRMPPGWDGVETIRHIWAQYPEMQVVICTAYSEISWEEQVREMSKSDNLLILKKPFDNIEVLQLAHALTQKWNLALEVNCRLRDLDELVKQRTLELQTTNEELKKENRERRQAEQALRRSEERFSKAFKASPIPLAILSAGEQLFVDANQGFLALTGYGAGELIGRSPAHLKLWAGSEGQAALSAKDPRELSVRNVPGRFRSKTGRVADILLSAEMIELDGQSHLLVTAQDITEQIQLQNQLQQARKMEAVGQLAAGVAHDFSNILTVVQGNASLLLTIRDPEGVEAKLLQSICTAAERASRLVRQLLAFSRQQPLELRPVNLRETLATVSDILPRILTESVKVTLHAPPGLPEVNADSAMLEALIMNLAFNARDAMPEGGQLKIAVEAVELTASNTGSNPDARPGNFVRLTVSDTGTGIAPEVLPRIFDPFFTTKPVGKGTGLGLATVYGIARQHQGWVEVSSQVGDGTTFLVFMPALSSRQPRLAPKEPPPSATKAGRETILVVEDEPDLRDLVAQVLESRDYRVITAASGMKALETWAQRIGKIDLLLTDMVMPDGLTGRKLAERLRGDDPRLRVIFTSGYTAGMPGSDLDNVEQSNFLAKPYRPATLLQVVRDCLDRPLTRAAAPA